MIRLLLLVGKGGPFVVMDSLGLTPKQVEKVYGVACISLLRVVGFASEDAWPLDVVLRPLAQEEES